MLNGSNGEKDDPLFGVATWAGKEKDGSSPWTEEEFYALGESDWRDFVSHWQHYGVSKQSCMEIGCGAGRITKSLATYFDHVIAVDVSPDMIDCARRAIKSGNVEFSLIDGFAPSASRRFSNCYFHYLCPSASG